MRAVSTLSKIYGRNSYNKKTHFIISGIHKQPFFATEQSGLLDRLGEDNFCGDLDEALKRALVLTKQDDDKDIG